MSWTPADSAIKLTPEIEAALEQATANEIPSILKDAAIQQGLYTRDTLNPQWLIETSLATAPKRFAQTVTDPKTGEKVIFEGATELEVAKQSNEYMREHFSQPAAETRTEQPRDTQSGRFVERLQEAVEEVQNSHVVQSWADATKNFLQSPEGAEWPGGEANKNILGEIISKNPELLDAENKQAAILSAYRHALAHGLLGPNEDTVAANELNDEIAACSTPEQIRNLIIARRGGDSGLFS